MHGLANRELCKLPFAARHCLGLYTYNETAFARCVGAANVLYASRTPRLDAPPK